MNVCMLIREAPWVRSRSAREADSFHDFLNNDHTHAHGHTIFRNMYFNAILNLSEAETIKPTAALKSSL